MVLALVSVTTFGIMMASPGGPSLLADPKLSQAERAAIEQQLGLDRPPVEQLRRWAVRTLKGDLGRSFLYQTPTTRTIAARVPNTLTLGFSALFLAIGLGVPLGVYAAARPRGLVDRLAVSVSAFGMSVPVFWLGIVVILVFSVWGGVLPPGGAAEAGSSILARFEHVLLPATVLATSVLADFIRYARSTTLTALAQPYVRVARARGVPPHAVLWRYAARPALVSVLSIVGFQFPKLVGGAAITETVFSWPGMGRLGVEAALARDYPLVMGVTLTVSVLVVVGALLADVLQMRLDPRLRAR